MTGWALSAGMRELQGRTPTELGELSHSHLPAVAVQIVPPSLPLPRNGVKVGTRTEADAESTESHVLSPRQSSARTSPGRSAHRSNLDTSPGRGSASGWDDGSIRSAWSAHTSLALLSPLLSQEARKRAGFQPGRGVYSRVRAADIWGDGSRNWSRNRARR